MPIYGLATCSVLILADGGLAPHDTLRIRHASYDCRNPPTAPGIAGMQNVANHQDRQAATL